MNLPLLSRSSIIVSAFPLLVVSHSVAFYLLPFLTPVATALGVALVGLVATGVAVARVAAHRKRDAMLLIALVAATWVAWAFCPTRELGVTARFLLEKHKYEEAIAQTRGGAQPACLGTHACASDGHTPPYVVFPFPGLLNSWVGIVHVPGPDQFPLFERMASFAAASVCDPKPLAPQYYVCNFY